MIDYGNLEKSLRHLELQFRNYQQAQNRPELTAIDREAIAESVIQRFETCYDCLWKILKRYLTEDRGLPDVPNSPKPILKLAGQNNLLSSSVQQWLRYADARIDTAHDYSSTKAADTIGIVEGLHPRCCRPLPPDDRSGPGNERRHCHRARGTRGTACLLPALSPRRCGVGLWLACQRRRPAPTPTWTWLFSVQPNSAQPFLR